jgi:PGF-CTERM protein/surface glycoprotein (TIGR04207 family)
MTGNNKVRSIVLSALLVFSVFAGTMALSGAAAAQDAPNETTETLVDGDVVFVGQTVTYEDTGADESGYTLVDSEGNFVREYAAGQITINIDGEEIDEGSYTLRTQGADTEIDFTVATQTLSAEFDGEDSLDLNSNRGTYFVTVSSGDVDGNVSDVFAEGDALDEVDGFQLEVPSNGSLNLADDLGLEGGEYDFSVEVVDTGVTADATLGVGVTPDSDAEFTQSVYEGTRGDIVEIGVEFSGATDSANVTLGSDDVNYVADFTVTDGDGDGEATIVFNTYETLNGAAAFSASSGDSVDVGNATSLDSIISSEAAYDLSASVDGEETDVATLAINEGSIDSFEISTAPGAVFGDAETVSDVENVSSDSDTVAAGDVVVHRLEATGIFGAVTSAGGVQDFIQSDDAQLTLSETSSGPNAEPASAVLDDSGAYNVVTDGEGVVYVNVDSSQLDTDTFEPGQELQVELTLNASSNLVAEQTSLNDTFSLVPRTAAFATEEIDDTDTIVVRAENNTTITGETSVAPGTEFNVRVRSTGDNPFLLDDDVTVQEDGTFAAEFDFADVSPNTTFTASIVGGNFVNTPTDVPGVINAPRTADVTIEDQEVANGSDQTVTVASAELSEGGFITIHDGTLLDGAVLESVRGTSDYLESGDQSDVEVTLDTPYTENGTAIAMPHLDTNGNEEYDFVTSNGSDDLPYTEGGAPVTDDASITVTQGNESATATVSIEDQTTNGEFVTVASATLPEGGFVTIHDGTLQDGATLESVRGTSEYLESGDQSDLNITLDTPYTEDGTAIAMPHMDTNDNQEYDFVTSEGESDGPYTNAEGQPVTASASLTVETGDGTETGTGTTEDPGTDTETVDDPGTATTMAPADTTEATEPGTGTSDGDGPGFGIVVALIALVAAALLAARRDE